ncbi:TPA: hypothetical protein RU586_004728 [Salmonella enterica]|nr:hypothetical protein [Salmonella enterica]
MPPLPAFALMVYVYSHRAPDRENAAVALFPDLRENLSSNQGFERE